MSLTIHEWVSTGGRNFGTASNWSNGSVPVGSTDVAFFSGKSQVAPLEGLDRGSAEFILRTGPGWLSNIAKHATPLKWDKTTFGIHTLRGAGEVHISMPAASGDYRHGIKVDNPEARLVSHGTRPIIYLMSGEVFLTQSDACSWYESIFILGRDANLIDYSTPGVSFNWGGVAEFYDIPAAPAGDLLRNVFLSGTTFLREGFASTGYIGPQAIVNVDALANLNSAVFFVGGVLDVSGATQIVSGVPAPPYFIIFPGGDVVGSLSDVDPYVIDLRKEYP